MPTIWCRKCSQAFQTEKSFEDHKKACPQDNPLPYDDTLLDKMGREPLPEKDKRGLERWV